MGRLGGKALSGLMLAGSIVAGSILGACGIEQIEESSSTQSSSAQSEAVQTLGASFCRWYYDCGCEPTNAPHRTVEECQLHATTEIIRRLDQGRQAELNFDGTCLSDYTDYFEAAECATASDVAFDAALRGALDSMLACKPWSGGATEGQSCAPLETAKGDDCAPGLACDATFEVCVPSTLAPAGASCGGISAPCEAGLSCIDEGSGDRCIRLHALGEDCEPMSCSAGGWCGPAGTCLALPSAGHACVDGGNPFAWGCGTGSSCEVSICVLGPAEDEPCNDGSCGPGLGCVQGQCLEAPALVCDLELELP